MQQKSDKNHLRIDKWLWAARFYKTRQLAIKAIKNARIKLNNQRLKPSSTIKVGDYLKIKRGVFEIEIEVLGLSEQRAPASIAQTLYQETPTSEQRQTKLKQQLANQPKIDFNHRKPDKRDVRQHRKAKRGEH